HLIDLGAVGFRCRAPGSLPSRTWRPLIREAKALSPDVVFLADTLGMPEAEVTALADAGFDYLFNSVKWWDFESAWALDQYERHRRIAPSISFPENPDGERLVAELLAAGHRESQI